MARIYIALVVVDPGNIPKVEGKHIIDVQELKTALQWPARVETAYEDHPEHGGRWIAFATDIHGRALFAALLPRPEHEGENAEVWTVKTCWYL